MWTWSLIEIFPQTLPIQMEVASTLGVLAASSAGLPAAIIGVGALPAAIAAARGKLIETPIAFLGLSFVFFYGISAFGALLRGLDSSPTFIAAGLTAIYGLFASYVGYLVLRSPARSVAASLPVFKEPWKLGRLRLVQGVLLTLGTVGLAARFIAAGTFTTGEGVAPAALQTDRISEANWSVPLLLAHGVALVIWLALIRRNGTKRDLRFWILGAALYVAVYALVGSRSRILFAFVPAFGVFHLTGRGRKTWRPIVGLIVALAAYIGYGQVRDTIFLESPIRAKTSSIEDYIANHGDLMVFRATMDVMDRYPVYRDFTNGSTLVVPVTNWVPRSVWPEKPLPASAVYTSIFDPRAWDRGVTAVVGLIGELYMNGGHGVVLIGMFVLGGLLRLLGEYRNLARGNTGVDVLYSLMILPVATLARGDLAFVFFNAETSLAIAVGCLVFFSGLRKNAPSSTSIVRRE